MIGFFIFFEQVHLFGAADQVRTGPKSLEGSCATTTPQPHIKKHQRNTSNSHTLLNINC